MLVLLLLASAAETPRLTPAALPPVARDAVRVFLVRHGQALSNLDPAPELPPEKLDRLTDLGRTQARRAAEALRPVPIERILTSPAGRARETATALAEVLGLSVDVETRLRPLELGRGAEGRELDWDAREAEWEAGRDPAPEGGESLEGVGRRVLALISELAKRPGRSLVLVAHGEVIAAFTGELADVPGPKRWPPTVPNGSITVVDARAGERPSVLLASHVPAPASR
ncbi:MAG TPA: histidine phosphatase family protein [Vicinamibacteria bacterium]|nr:histidine phosphatase family protein [Vicinamibacteria bacterium]